MVSLEKWLPKKSASRGLGFKPKKVLSRQIGLVIQGNSLGAVDVVCGEDKPRVEWCELRTIGPAGARETFTDLLRERKLKHVDCAAVLPMDRYEVFVEELVANIASEEQADALRWNVIDRLDYSPSAAVIGVFEQPPPPRSSSKKMAYVVATNQENISDYVSAFYQRGKTRITGIDIHELALRNIASYLPEDSEGVAVLHLRAKDGLLVVTRDHTLYLARKIELGLDRIFSSLGGLSGSAELEQSLKLCSELDEICQQVQSTLDYYLSRFMPSTIERLYLAPMERPMAELRSAISDRLAVRVKVIRLEEIVNFVGGVPDEATQGRLLPALGVRLAHEDCSDVYKQKINLFNSSFLPKIEIANAEQVVAVAVGLILLVTVASGYLFWIVASSEKQLAMEKSRLSAAETRVGKLAIAYPTPKIDEALERQIRQIDATIMVKKLIGKILEGSYDFGNTKGFSGYFSELAKDKLAGVWLSRMRIYDGGERFGLYGKAIDPERIPAMIAQFKNSVHLSGHAYSLIKVEKNGVHEFSLLTHPMEEGSDGEEKGNSMDALKPQSPFAFLMEKFIEKALSGIIGKN